MKTVHKNRTIRLLAVIMSMLMLVTLAALFRPTANADTWNGTVPGSATGFSNNHITSAAGLVWFIKTISNGTDYNGVTVYLDVDVDLGSHDFGNNVFPYNTGRKFKGTFNGQNHTISNFKMTSDNHRVAMFRQTENATFKNLNFSGVFIDDASDSNKRNGFAVLVGYHDAGNLTFENVHVNSGNIYGYNYVGALVGEVGANSSGNQVTITNCSNGATINALNVRIGGLVGSSLPMVIATNCSNTGNVTGGSTDVGGIVGWIEDDPSSFTGCSNSGAIQGTDSVGGILGYFGNNSQDQRLTLTNNTNTGNITSNNRAAGICALIDTDNDAHQISGNVNRGTISAGSDGGGIVARNKGHGNWTNNENFGSVTGSGDNAGGICGEVEDDKQVFTNCYNSGAISGKNTIGGVMGWLDTASDNTFTNCANSGAITSSNGYAGGVVGACKKLITFTECYNVGAIKGVGDSGGICAHVDYHTFFKRCWNAGSVNSNGMSNTNSRGGLIGYTSYNGSSSNTAMVDDCYNWGSVSNGQYTGGLVGRVNSGNSAYRVQYSYNCGPVSGGNAAAIISSGGTLGSKLYYNSNVSMGTVQGEAKTNDEFINYGTNGFTIYSTFCQNTWGVKINGTTYYYPIHVWYRNLFTFNSTFVDGTSDTNTTISKLYNNSFSTPTVSGVSGTWVNDDNWNASFAQGASINPGVTAPTNTYVITQETSDVRSIHNDTTYHLQRALTLNTEETVAIRTGGDSMYYRFSPSDSGQYVFFSYGSSGDTTITVTALDTSASNGRGSQIGYGDDYDGSSYGNDLSLSNTETQIKCFDGVKVTNLIGAYRNQSYCVVNLTAGTTYVVDASTYSGMFSYPMKVCKAVNITFNPTGGTAAFTVPLPAGHPIRMNESGLTRADHTLIAWSTAHATTQNKTCMANTTLTVPSEATTYYALWNPTSPTTAAVATDYTVTVSSDYQVVYYSFTPSETRKYYIHSTNSSSEPDPYVVLAKASDWASGATYFKSDDDGDGNHQFAIKDQVLTAGTTYLIGAKLYDGGTGSYTFRIDPIYNVTYNANGGSGAPSAQDKYYGKNLTLSSSTPTLTGYDFLGWATSSSAATADYAAGGTYTANADATLYAVWQIKHFAITFKNGSTTLQSSDWNYGTTPNYNGNTPTKAYDDSYHYTFSGWSPSITTVTSAATYTAQFTSGAHSYGIPTYSWTGTSSCTASRTCPIDGGHSQTDTATVTSTVTTAATCTDTGVRTYTATFTNSAFSTQTTTQTIAKDPNNHASYAQALDNTTVSEPTYLGTGYTGDEKCAGCHAVRKAGNTVPALRTLIDLDDVTLEDISGTSGKVALAPTKESNIGFEIVGFVQSGGDHTLYKNKPSVDNTLKMDGVRISIGSGGDKIEYKFTKMDFTTLPSFYALVKVTGTGNHKYSTNEIYTYQKVTLVPAKNVMIDDTVEAITYANAKNTTSTSGYGIWKRINDSGSTVTDATDSFGDIATAQPNTENSVKYSFGDAHQVSVANTFTAKDGPTATFTFTGSGFDVISVTDSNSGVFAVQVYAGSTATGTAIKNKVIDTYYGYTYSQVFYNPLNGRVVDADNPHGTTLYEAKDTTPAEERVYNDFLTVFYTTNEEWALRDENNAPKPAYGWVLSSGNNVLYQVPALSLDLGAVGTYTVVIQPRFTASFGHYNESGDVKYFNFTLDGVRIYNPAGGNSDALAFYRANGETYTYYELVRESINDEDLVLLYGATQLQGGELTSYIKGTPKNELYLLPNGTTAFDVTFTNLTDARIGLRAANGSPCTVTLSNGTQTQTVTVSSATEQYYSLQGLLTEGATTTVTVTNNGSGMLSVTRLMTTTNTPPSTPSSAPRLSVSADTAEVALRTAAMLNADIAIDESTVETAAANDGTVTVTLQTGADAETIVVRNAEGNVVDPDSITCTLDETGVKNWTVVLTAESEGEITYTLQAEYENGYAPVEPTAVTVTVHFADTQKPTENDPTENDPTESDSILSFLRRLANIIKSFIELIRSIVEIF